VSGSDAPTRGTKARAAKSAPATPKAALAKPTRGEKPTKTEKLDPDRLAALEEERDFLLRSLRDLEAEHEVGDVDDHDYAALEDDYTARAAAVIRAIEGQRAERAAAPRHSLTWRVVVAAVVAVLAVGAGVLVAQWSGSRGAGDSITGGIRTDTRDELVAARQEAASGNFLQAAKDYQSVIDEDPANVEALAYEGWMNRLLAGEVTGSTRAKLLAKAKSSLQAALATDAKDPTSLIFMAAVLDDLGQPKAALADLDQVPAKDIPSVVKTLVDQLRTRLQSELH
jgi:hypothetical protein